MNVVPLVKKTMLPLFATVVLSGQIGQISPSAIQTAKQAMWDQYVFHKGVDAANSVGGRKQGGASSGNAALSEPPAAPPTWKRINADDGSFSALAPPEWKIEKSSLPRQTYIIFEGPPHRKAGDGEEVSTYVMSMSFFPMNLVDSNRTDFYLTNLVNQWANGRGIQLPSDLGIAPTATTFGTGSHMLLEGPNDLGVREEIEYGLLARRTGLFLIRINRPVNDHSQDKTIAHVFSTLSFRDKTQAEATRETMRYADYGGH